VAVILKFLIQPFGAKVTARRTASCINARSSCWSRRRRATG